MTILSAINRVDYVGTGAVSTYGFTFKIFVSSDLFITQRDTSDVETTLVLTTDYTVLLNGDGTGTITLVAGNLTTDYELTIRRVRPLTQDTDIRNQGAYFAELHENAFDHQVMIGQQQQDEIDRSVKTPETITASDFSPNLPSNILEGAGRALKINDPGNGFDLGPTATEVAQALAAINSSPPWFNVLDYGAGTRTAATTLTAIAEIEADLGVGAKYGLLFKRGDWTMDTVTIPSNVHSIVENGVNFQVATTETFTINGPRLFPNSKIFSLTGTGSVVFGSGHRSVNALWFGVDPSETTDSAPAINAAISSIVEGEVLIPSSDYRIEEEIVINKNNIMLVSDATCNLVVPSTISTTSGYAIKCEATGSGNWPVNIGLKNIFVEISTNSGSNKGGMLLGCSYSTFWNFGSRIHGDNMIGFKLQTDEAGSGPYYNVFINPTVQADSNSGTPLTGVIGWDYAHAPTTTSRSPNTNTTLGGRTGGCYDAMKIRGAGNRFFGMTHESTNQYVYWFGHETTSSGSIRNVVIGPYIEHHATNTIFYFQTNASSNLCINPYYTAAGTVFNDQSTGKNNRFLDASNIPNSTAVIVKANGYFTHPTTIDSGFNIASVTNPSTGKYIITFTNNMAAGQYHTDVSNIGTGAALMVRIDQQLVGSVSISFWDDTAALTNVANFTLKVSETPVV